MASEVRTRDTWCSVQRPWCPAWLQNTINLFLEAFLTHLGHIAAATSKPIFFNTSGSKWRWFTGRQDKGQFNLLFICTESNLICIILHKFSSHIWSVKCIGSCWFQCSSDKLCPLSLTEYYRCEALCGLQFSWLPCWWLAWNLKVLFQYYNVDWRPILFMVEILLTIKYIWSTIAVLYRPQLK